jgi:hypothetical protein
VAQRYSTSVHAAVVVFGTVAGSMFMALAIVRA